MARHLSSFLFRAARLTPSQGKASMLLTKTSADKLSDGRRANLDDISSNSNSQNVGIIQHNNTLKDNDKGDSKQIIVNRQETAIKSLIKPVKEELKAAGSVIDEVDICLNNLSTLIDIARTRKHFTFIYDPDLVSALVAKGNETQWKNFCDAALGVLLVVSNLSQVSTEKTDLGSITSQLTTLHEILRTSFEDALSAYSEDERRSAESKGLGAVHKITSSISQLISELKGEQVRILPSRPLTARDLGTVYPKN